MPGMGWTQGTQEIPVIVAKATLEEFSDRIEALGTLRANETVDLTATVAERVTFIGFEDGKRVSKGDVLLRQSSSEEEALLREVRAMANESELQYERARQLAATGAAATAQLDEARRIFDTAKARVHAIESRIANLTITAPFDGVVGLRNISIGAVLQPGDMITTLDDDSKMLLDFSVPATFLPVLAEGTPISARAAGYEGELFEGQIRSISSRVDPITRSVLVRAEIPNEERILKPGLLMTVEIKGNLREAVMVKEEAVLSMGDRSFVMVVDEETTPPTVHRTEVRLGGRRQGEVEILEGLEEGQKVVAHGTMRVSDGSNVRILAEDTGDVPIAEKIRNSNGID